MVSPIGILSSVHPKDYNKGGYCELPLCAYTQTGPDSQPEGAGIQTFRPPLRIPIQWQRAREPSLALCLSS